MKSFRLLNLSGFTLFLVLTTAAFAASEPPLPSFDFTDPAVRAQWGQPHHVSSLRPTPEGLEITINGDDPYFYGPARDYPTNELWLDLKLRSDAGGTGQIFWFRQNATEENSTHFNAPAGQWANVRVPIPPLGKNYRLRLDPPGVSGRCLLASLRAIVQPHWTLPKFPSFTPRPWQPAESWWNGRIAIRPLSNSWGGFELASFNESNKQPFRLAQTHPHPMIGYVRNGEEVWFDPGAAPEQANTLVGAAMTSVATDPHGGHWTITRIFPRENLKIKGLVATTITVDQDRDIIFLPVLMLCITPGNANKQQAIFPGLEYLDNEPSSSEADLIGPASKRYVPDNLKITFPWMALLTSNHWISMSWHKPVAIWRYNPLPTQQTAAFFDSPDRTFGTSGHVMGLLFPGSDGRNRTDGRWLPNESARLKAGEKLSTLVEIQTGTGTSLQPAIEAYITLYPTPQLPPIPEKTPSWNDYFSMTAGGWLDSKAREGNRIRHAVWPGFGLTHAADAAAYMDWLASQTDDGKMIERLTNTAAEVLRAVPPSQWSSAQIGHVRSPVAALVYGHVAENQRTARAHAQALLSRFTPEGFVRYQVSPGKEDYARTYFTNHANGLTAQVTSTLLEEAAFSGEQNLIQEALKKVRALKTLYHDSVPRGAQTWEVPLHTPDILASVYLLRATAFAFELTGDKDFLDQASYWAWTGVPFVYLVNPVEKAVGPYATIPVFGATSWRAPVWMGLPVQWCGLVYADALYRFRGDAVPDVPWRKLADGITASGIQMSWPTSDKERQGLLPDSFVLREQKRDGPAINPGTVQACAARFYNRTPVYDCRVLRVDKSALIVQAPGEILPEAAPPSRAAFTVVLWPRHAAWVLVNGLTQAPQVKINGQRVELAAPHEYDAAAGSLRLQLQGRVKVELE